MTMKDNDKSNDLKWMGSGCLDLVMTVWHVLHFVRMRLTRIIDMMYEPPYVNKSFWSRINFLYTHSVNILSFGSVGRETSPIDWSVRYLVLSKFCTMERISSFPFLSFLFLLALQVSEISRRPYTDTESISAVRCSRDISLLGSNRCVCLTF